MHPSLTELLENQRSGLLWVTRDAVVRYANSEASQKTSLATGAQVFDPTLARAIAESVNTGVAKAVSSLGVASSPGGTIPELQCRVIPGLSRDDAFVLIRDPNLTDPSDAFGNLMVVIRSDLHEPLNQMQHALMLARDGDGHHVDALVDQLSELTQVTGKLVDLATVWGSGTLLASDRIELWPLLQAVWGELEPLAMNRNIKVRFRSQEATGNLGTIYGSEQWLKRVFLECLESAIRSSRSGSTLDIVHRQLGPRALLVFRDCGVFAQRDDQALALQTQGAHKGPGPSPDARLSAREYIGLKLCRHIVNLHGGELREEEEDGLRNFLIDLPTGAPHRAEKGQLDIAQAQRYASDLAALMARARKNAAPESPPPPQRTPS
jgi:hypothetical protein